MERLTEHHVNKTLGAYMVCSGACIKEDFDCTLCENLNKIVNTLAAYEDTGLTPEGIIELKGSWRAACKFYGINPASSISNAPLTLDELREMDGEPVWCEKFEWRICYGVSDFRGCLCMETGAGSCIQLNDYGKTWLAYRRKPEEETP